LRNKEGFFPKVASSDRERFIAAESLQPSFEVERARSRRRATRRGSVHARAPRDHKLKTGVKPPMPPAPLIGFGLERRKLNGGDICDEPGCAAPQHNRNHTSTPTPNTSHPTPPFT